MSLGVCLCQLVKNLWCTVCTSSFTVYNNFFPMEWSQQLDIQPKSEWGRGSSNNSTHSRMRSFQRLSPKKGASDECSLPGVRHTIARCINRRAQQHIHHLPWKRGRIADVNCRLRVCDVIKSRMGPHRLPAWRCGQCAGRETGNSFGVA